MNLKFILGTGAFAALTALSITACTDRNANSPDAPTDTRGGSATIQQPQSAPSAEATPSNTAPGNAAPGDAAPADGTTGNTNTGTSH